MNESAENYLETILVLSNRIGQVRSIDVVNETGFSKPSISEAMKKLKKEKLIQIDVLGSIFLTDEGMKKAKAILERHKILKQAFINLGVPEDIAEEDACKIEHSLNEITFQKIKAHWSSQKDD